MVPFMPESSKDENQLFTSFLPRKSIVSLLTDYGPRLKQQPALKHAPQTKE
jgi:hypothetical protein